MGTMQIEELMLHLLPMNENRWIGMGFITLFTFENNTRIGMGIIGSTKI